MPDLPRVSIITPSFKQAAFLERTIQSVLSQNYPNLEYIIIDGGSTDGSVEIIQRYADKLAYWVSERDKNHADALNKGFARATGEVYAWLNSDDTYEPNAIAEAVAYLQEHPEVGMVYGDANLIDVDDQFIGRFPAAQTDYHRLLQGFVHIPQQSTFWRGSLHQQIGGIDASFYFSMDYDLWVRLAKAAPIVYYPRLWSNFRLHSAAKTTFADSRCWPDMVRVYQRETGRRFGMIVVKAKLRALFYAWLPLRLKVQFRKIFPRL